jgi:predicted nucleotidyltransferase
LHHARFQRLQARSKAKKCIEQLVVIGILSSIVHGKRRNDDVALTHSDNDDDDNSNNNSDARALDTQKCVQIIIIAKNKYNL